jgi:uncharacterized membrane-anchored protein YhcB (DUF1043 family)
MWWYLVAFVIGIVTGLIIEQKFDLLKPKHVRQVEKEISRLRSEIRALIAELG